MFRLSVSKLNVHVPVVGADPCVRPMSERHNSADYAINFLILLSLILRSDLRRTGVGRTHGSAPTCGGLEADSYFRMLIIFNFTHADWHFFSVIASRYKRQRYLHSYYTLYYDFAFLSATCHQNGAIVRYTESWRGCRGVAEVVEETGKVLKKRCFPKFI